VIARIGPGPLPKVSLVYHHPGRLRLRGEVLVRSAGAADRMRDAVSGLDGIGRVVHNARSGSLLVEYAPERIDVDAILTAMADDAGVDLDETPRRRREASRLVVGAARVLDARVGEATRGAADLHGVVSFALGVGAITSLVLARQPRLPRWDNLLYWSYTFFRDVHLRDIKRATRNPPR
jgi:hypothetical protein